MNEAKRRTQTERILEMLAEAGPAGVRNYDLMKISYQWPHKIWILRHKHGLNIETKRVRGSEWRVIFHPDEPSQVGMF